MVNNILLVVPHLLRAWSTYKATGTCACTNTHTKQLFIMLLLFFCFCAVFSLLVFSK